MYLKDRNNGDLVEVLDTEALFDPNKSELSGRYHAGEEMQEATAFAKDVLIFPSGEALPKCWVDPAYRG